jgi:cytochrome P450
MATTPEILSELLVTKCYDFPKPDDGRDILRIILGDGLVVSEGDVHKFQRKNLNPMFSFRHIKDLYPLMWSKSVELVDCVKAQVSTSGSIEKSYVLEVKEWISRATLDIIGVAALGRNFNSLRNNDDELATLYEWLFRIDTSRKLWFLVNLHLPMKVVDLLPWKIHHETVAKSAVLRRVCGQLLKDKRNAMMGDAVESVDTLAHLIRSNNFSDQELIDQILTFLAAG